MENIINNTKAQDDELEATLRELQWCMKRMAGMTTNGPGCDASDYSISSTLDEIMNALSQPNISIIGLYGSSDERKCRVVEKIIRRVNRDNLFDVVLIASVMKEPDFKRIQAELGYKLGLELHDNATVEGRARRLCERIKMKDRILVILEDLWGGINLARIGIPFGNDHNGCKILLTSHSQEVLSNQMNTQLEFSVD